MAEQQQIHRHKLESTVITSNVSASQRGQYFGLIISIVTVGCGSYVMYSGRGNEGYGLAAVISAIAGLVSVFIYGRSREDKERKQNVDALPPQLK